jgi:hypothetical protein
MKKISLVILLIFSINSFHCGELDNITDYQMKLMSVVFNCNYRMYPFENNIACFYSKNKIFPANEIQLNEFLDSLNIHKSKDGIFSKLKLVDSNKHSTKFYFELYPFSDTSAFSNSSIRVYKFTGIVTFDDSLFSTSNDSILVKFKADSISATVYEKDDSVYFDKSITSKLVKYTIQNIPVNDNCIK